MSGATQAIVAKDWTDFRRDPRFVMMALVALVLALAAVATSYVRVAAWETDRIATEARDRQTWLNQGERNPHGAAHFSSWAMRPLTPTALLDPGVVPYAGTAVWMEAHKQNAARNRPVQDSASAFDLGQFSLGWIVQIVVPLLLFVVGAGLIARERERGTLRLIVASAGDGSKVVDAKFKALARTAAMLLGPVLVAGAVAAMLLAGRVNGDSLLRLGGWLFSYGAFLFVVIAAAVAVSAFSRNTSRAMVALIGIWLVAALLVPRVASGIGAALAPTPAPEVFASGIAADRMKYADGHASPVEALTAIILKRYGVARVEDLPVSMGGLQLEEGERQGNRVFDRHFGDLTAIYQQQRAIVRLVGVVSPVTSLQNISMALAGTDLPSQLAFQEQAETHRRAVVTMLNSDMIRNAGRLDFDYKTDRRLWSKTPEFQFQPSPLERVLRTVLADILILLGWVGLGGVMLARARRHLAKEAL